MKKLAVIIIGIFVLFTFNLNVYAKDTVYSINKYNEEKLTLLEKSYNDTYIEDGYITAGIINKKSTMTETNKAILVKYDLTGNLMWKYVYNLDNITGISNLTYTYDSNGNVNGYLLNIPRVRDNTTSKSIFLCIDLDGKLVSDNSSNLNDYETINKIIPIYNSENKMDGYIAIGNKEKDNKTIGLIVRYDKDLNIIWYKENNLDNYSYIDNIDIVNIYEDNNLVGYSLLTNYKNDESNIINLERLDLEGNLINSITGIEKYNSYFLEETDNGTILYGTTSDVKISKGDFTYYLIKYNLNNEEEWESIGDISVSNSKYIKLLRNSNEYLLSYVNSSDKSIEVIKLDSLGTYLKKVKKINNDYYTVENFDFYNNVIYFIGQINCPEDDNCSNDASSLFLISDEDKVIEVEENDNKYIYIVTIGIILLIVIGVLFKKKKKMN
jgi:hypothetical protein